MLPETPLYGKVKNLKFLFSIYISVIFRDFRVGLAATNFIDDARIMFLNFVSRFE